MSDDDHEIVSGEDFIRVDRMPTLRGRIAVRVMQLAARWGFPGRKVRFIHIPKP